MSDQRDYPDSVFLPKTDVPLNAGLPGWQRLDMRRPARDATEAST